MWGPQGGGRGSGVLAHYTPPSPPFFDSSDVPAAADTGSGRPGFFYFYFFFSLSFIFLWCPVGPSCDFSRKNASLGTR